MPDMIIKNVASGVGREGGKRRHVREALVFQQPFQLEAEIPRLPT